MTELERLQRTLRDLGVPAVTVRAVTYVLWGWLAGSLPHHPIGWAIFQLVFVLGLLVLMVRAIRHEKRRGRPVLPQWDQHDPFLCRHGFHDWRVCSDGELVDGRAFRRAGERVECYRGCGATLVAVEGKGWQPASRAPAKSDGIPPVGDGAGSSV